MIDIPARVAALAAMGEPDTSDIPEQGEEDFRRARFVRYTRGRKSMKISIFIEEATEEDVRRMFGTSPTQVIHDEVAEETAMTVLTEEGQTYEAAVAEAGLVEDEGPKPPVEDEPPADDELPPAASGEEVEDMVAIADAKWKRTQTVTLGSGEQVKGDAAVRDEDGVEAIILATYRGKAVIGYEGGEQALVEGKTLTFDGAPDEAPPAEEEEKPAAAKANGAAPAEGATLESVRTLLGQVQEKQSRQAAADLIRKHGNGQPLSTLDASALSKLAAEAEAALL